VQLQDLAPADAQSVAALLDEALELPLPQRAAWQAELALREPRWHALVGELLASLTDSSSSSARGAETADLLQQRLARLAMTHDMPHAAPMEGRRFGPYRVLRLLGQGGMGSVWLAERADGLFERQVALKLVHPSLAGATLHERFARERSILGALVHPQIARLLDAGVAPDGQPYLALEYVDGVSLTEYCDTRRLTLHARLAMMMQVLAVVQYAHQNLVIHRDLKPTNILVTHDGQVRLLDFGIAKLMNEGQAAETELTILGGRALTPDCASPEQIAGRPLSTASDVYSLGVLLYTLLCGQRPYRLARESRGALEDAILSAQVLRPSQQTLTAEIAQARGTTPARLARALAGDLDTIVLKALKKDPAERYATADALRQDLQRHLSGLPVQAQPDSWTYRLNKFVGRHRLQVSLGLSTALVVVAAAGVSIWQARQAQTQEAAARREAQRAQTVQAFLLDIFKTNTEQQADPARARQTTARELLDVGARRAAEKLKDAPEAQIEVLNTLADLQQQLGLPEDAARLRQQGIAALKKAYGNNDPRVASALLAYADDISETALRVNAPAALEEARQILDRAGDTASSIRGWVSILSATVAQYLSLAAMRQHADDAVRHFRAHPARWNDLFHALQAAARSRYLAGDFVAAQQGHRQALDQAQQHAGDGTAAWEITPRVQLAEAHIGALELELAEQQLRTALAQAQRLRGSQSGAAVQTQAKLGGLLHSTGRRGEGMRLLDEAQAAVKRPDAGSMSNAVSAVHRFRGTALLEQGRAAEAEQAFAAEIADLRMHYPDSLPLSRMLLLQATALRTLGRHDSSRQALDEAWRLWQAFAGDAAHPAAHNGYRLEQARLLLAQGDAAGADGALQALAPPPGTVQLQLDQTEAQLIQAQARLRQGRAQEAQDLAQQALDHVQSSVLRERYPRLEAEAALRLGQALQQQGQPQAARVHLERALVLRQQTEAPPSPWLAEARTALAGLAQKPAARSSQR
jgi:eukaryotic-like serine/threonine-protein kinase